LEVRNQVSETGPSRSRIINEIRSLDQALKVEKDVASAYAETIKENISYWLAVEQDIIDSYTMMVNESQDTEIREALSRIVEDSKSHVEVLESMIQSFSKMLRDEERHTNILAKFQTRS
jgi:rubrerythrin